MALWLAAALLCSATALADPPRAASALASRSMQLGLSYQVPEECMSAGEFLQRFATHMLAGGDNGLLGSRIIVGRVGRKYDLAMQLNNSELIYLPPHPDCNQLLREAVLEAGMARRSLAQGFELAFLLANARAMASGDLPTSPVVLPDGEAPAPTAAAQPEENPSWDPEQAREPAFDGPPTDLPPASLSEAHKPPAYSLALHSTSAFGVLPDTALGQGLTLGLRKGDIRFHLSGTYWLAQDWDPWEGSLPGQQGRGLKQLRLLSLSASACSPLAQATGHAGEVALLTCARAGAFRLTVPAAASTPAVSLHASSLGGELGMVLSRGGLWAEFSVGLDMLVRGKPLRYTAPENDLLQSEVFVGEGLEIGKSNATVGFRLGLAFDLGDEPAVPDPGSNGSHVLAMGGESQ